MALLESGKKPIPMVLSVTLLLIFLVDIPKTKLISWLLKSRLISMLLLSKKCVMAGIHDKLYMLLLAYI